jgi:AraC family transcriptional regulator
MKLNIPSESSHKKVGRSRVIEGFELAEIAYEPRLEIPRHVHKDAGFCLVLQGSYTENYNRRALACKARTVTFSPAGEWHSNQFYDLGSQCFIIEIDDKRLRHVSEYGITLDRPVGQVGGSLTWLATKLYKEFQEDDDASTLSIEGLALEMIAETSRRLNPVKSSQIPRWLRQARDILHERFSERLTLSDVARPVGVHPIYLAALFRQHYHCTVGEHIRRLRIEFACREIAATDIPLAQIALAAGFAHQSQFSRTFKRLTGLTPAQYRSTFRAP